MKRLAFAAVIVAGGVVASPAQQRGPVPVTVPPMPTPEDVAAPAGWKPDGHIVPPMPLTLARLPRTAIAKARYPAIDFHVHAPDLTTDAAYKEFVAPLDRIGVGAIANMDGGTGAHLDAVLKAASRTATASPTSSPSTSTASTSRAGRRSSPPRWSAPSRPAPSA